MATFEDWPEPPPSTAHGARSARVEWVWTLVGLALLGAVLAVDDHLLRALISLN
jgi:hypothetical protein